MTQRRVLFVQYAHPSGIPPIERAARIVHADGWNVRMIGAHGLNTDALGIENLRGIDVRLVSRAGSGIAQKARYVRFLIACSLSILFWRPEWVYASDSFAAPVALLASLLGVRVVYHEHDAPTDEHPSRFMRAVLTARSSVLRRAEIVVTPNDERSRAISVEADSRAVTTVWNCPSIAELPSQPEGRHLTAPLKLVYHGSIVPGRPPISILDAMAKAHGPVELHIAGYETIGARGYVAELLRRAGELGLGDRVTALPAMPREQLLRRAAQCDMGLSLMPATNANSNERRMAGASNKAFEYLASGVPLIVSNLPDWRRLFVDAGVAWACDPENVDDMTALLDRAVRERQEVLQMGQRGRELVRTRWNYETQFAPVLGAMRGVAGMATVRGESTGA